MSEFECYTLYCTDALLSTMHTLLLIIRILKVVTCYLILFMHKLHILVTIQTKVTYISCMCFLPKDGLERVETYR
jgi:hypothetical protein